ncbi:hypothetical protein KA107_03350 [Candidatus Pacearchaeota archaeon]|nr:hypothetical protein [Candidatus Pacearchaeota archaeon]
MCQIAGLRVRKVGINGARVSKVEEGIKCTVEFEQRFKLTPEQALTLGKDIETLLAIPVPAEEIEQTGRGKPTSKRIGVSCIYEETPPRFAYFVSYESNLYNHKVRDRNCQEIYGEAYSSGDLKKIRRAQR